MNRRLAAIAILGVVAVGAVLFPTAAVPLGDDVDERHRGCREQHGPDGDNPEDRDRC